jgi:hypothetical protein
MRLIPASQSVMCSGRNGSGMAWRPTWWLTAWATVARSLPFCANAGQYVATGSS